jgi:hypothetical protein
VVLQNLGSRESHWTIRERAPSDLKWMSTDVVTFNRHYNARMAPTATPHKNVREFCLDEALAGRTLATRDITSASQDRCNRPSFTVHRSILKTQPTCPVRSRRTWAKWMKWRFHFSESRNRTLHYYTPTTTACLLTRIHCGNSASPQKLLSQAL